MFLFDRIKIIIELSILWMRTWDKLCELYNLEFILFSLSFSAIISLTASGSKLLWSSWLNEFFLDVGIELYPLVPSPWSIADFLSENVYESGCVESSSLFYLISSFFWLFLSDFETLSCLLSVICESIASFANLYLHAHNLRPFIKILSKVLSWLDIYFV